MFCSQCGSQMEQGAKFCGGCGTQIAQGGAQPQQNQEDVTNNAQENAPQQPPFQTNAQQEQQQGQRTTAAAVARPKADSEYVEKAKDTSRQYFQFALQSIKGPMAASRRATEKDKINGIISHVLLAFLLPLFSYFAARSLNNGFMSVEIPFGSMVIQPFFYILIFLTVFIAVNFGVGKMMKADVTFMSVLAKFGALNVIPVGLLLLSNLLAVLSMNALGTFFFVIGLSLFFVSTISLLFSINAEKKSGSGLDVYYGLILSNIVMAIFYAIVGVSVFERIMDQIESGPLGFFM